VLLKKMVVQCINMASDNKVVVNMPSEYDCVTKRVNYGQKPVMGKLARMKLKLKLKLMKILS